MTKLVSVEEAFEIISEKRGFVSSGGVTLYHDGYFAMGTYPSCLRGGARSETLQAFQRYCAGQRITQWEYLTFEDLVRKNGYYPTSISAWMHYRHFNIPPEELQAIFCLELDMVKYMIDSEYKVSDFKDYIKSVEIWNAFLDNYTGK